MDTSQHFKTPDWLAAQPRELLGHWPTPLEQLPRLSAELGGPQIWVKRDDCSGLATGGNKTRKLEYLLADATNMGADTIVTYGAVQSNHARQTAAACAKLGLECHLLLSRRVPRDDDNYLKNGNMLFNYLFGAQVHCFDLDEFDDGQAALLKMLEQRGKTVYQIPAGGSSAIGALGYSRCISELVWQAPFKPTQIIHASASAGTQAGLVFANAAEHYNIDILGINVFHPDPETLELRIERLLNAMAERFSPPAPTTPQIQINHAYFGEAYGQPTQAAKDAIKMFAAWEGLLLDPVYSSKAAAALIDQITLGNFDQHEHVVFIHTGGAASLSAYRDEF
ncbi:MAG: D-cysteine desulfhydrase family protein [Gammaproteobacteria bacterium TMED92]|nr:MAG: D-cysteine desulfhydrase family protein [Gammaproteobacteria bacterium TMED92]